jgi:hypothetical protein
VAAASPRWRPAPRPVSADRRNWLRDGVQAVPRAVALLDKPYIAAVSGAAAGYRHGHGEPVTCASLLVARFSSLRAWANPAMVAAGTCSDRVCRRRWSPDLDDRHDRCPGGAAHRLRQPSSRRIAHGGNVGDGSAVVRGPAVVSLRSGWSTAAWTVPARGPAGSARDGDRQSTKAREGRARSRRADNQSLRRVRSRCRCPVTG